jgi:hypothetical protein
MDGYVNSGVEPMTVAEAFKVPLPIAEWSIVHGGWAERVDLHDTVRDVDP